MSEGRPGLTRAGFDVRAIASRYFAYISDFTTPRLRLVLLGRSIDVWKQSASKFVIEIPSLHPTSPSLREIWGGGCMRQRAQGNGFKRPRILSAGQECEVRA